jgi:ADP-ribose pyrophosphatase
MAIAFQGRVFSVEVTDVEFPDGRRRRVEVVRHPPSVVLLPILDDGRVMLIRQFRASIGRWLWELPAGSVDEGESPEAAAARECAEEIGLVPQTIERLGGWFPTPGFCDEELIFFKVSRLQPPPADASYTADDDEDIKPQPFSIAEARALVARGEIVDLKTAYGLTIM